ncbi:hypothetical protein AB0B39_23680 [Micromonospora sp. NPDC049114]|uniref:hypothetical protein n=1 Tax=Micromonospora sp. NPDC049114 TaxID=3155498 RepID=UPI0033C432BE
MATEAGTAYVGLIPSAKGFARALKKDIAREFAGSKLDTLIGDALAGTTVSVPVKPEIDPRDMPDELPVRRGREPVLPVKLDPLTAALQADVRRQLAALTREAVQVDVGADTDGLRADVSAAINAVESSLSADVPTEPAGRAEYERQLRAQVDEAARTVRARIRADVDVDVDKPLRNGTVDKSGETVGRSLAASIVSSLGAGISTLSGPATFLGLTAAAVLVAPLIAATIAGGILAALGGGVIGLGIVALADDPRLKSAAGKLSTTLKDTLAKAAGPLLGTEQAPGPLLRAMETLQQLVVDIGPSLEQMFAAIGPYIPGLAEGIAAFVKEAMPGLVAAVQASGPILEVIALNLGPLGDAVGRFLMLMADLGPAAADALNVIFYLINHVIGIAGSLVWALGAAFGGLFQNVKDMVAGIAAAWAVIVNIFTGGTASVKQRVEAFIGATIRLFTGLWDRLTGGARGALNGVSGTFSGLPGRIRSAVGSLDNLLYQAGRNVVAGLINGIRSRFPDLGAVISQGAQMIRDHFPYSPAKTGPLSGSGNPYYSGQSIVNLLSSGVTGNLGVARSAASDLASTFALDGSPLSVAPGGGYGLSTTAPPPAPLVAEWVGGDGDPIMRAIRDHTRIYYGGSAQAALGSSSGVA